MKGKELMENKILAIMDMTVKISEHTPVDVNVRYYGFSGTLDVSIFWKGFKVSLDDCTDYVVVTHREPWKDFPNEITPDDMLGILEEIYSGGSNG